MHDALLMCPGLKKNEAKSHAVTSSPHREKEQFTVRDVAVSDAVRTVEVKGHGKVLELWPRLAHPGKSHDTR